MSDIRQLMREALMLSMVGDWRGFDAVMFELVPLFDDAPELGYQFNCELARIDALKQQARILSGEKR